MNKVTILGRYLFAFPLLILGIIYLVNAEMMTSMFPVMGGVVWVYVSGLVMLFAGVAILIRKKDAVATFLLGLLFLVYVFLIDLPNLVDADFTNSMVTAQLLRDLMIGGASFVYCRSAAHDRSWRLI